MRAELPGEGGALPGHLLLQLRIVVRELLQLHQVASASLEALPRGDELAVLAGLAGQLAGAARVVPRAWLRQLGV